MSNYLIKDLAKVAIKTVKAPKNSLVIGCAEGPSLFPNVAYTGMLVTAYDDAFTNKYSECKALKKKMGYQCMAPVFPGVSLSKDHQYWTSLLFWYIKECCERPGLFVTNKLVIQRCRGSEVDHTFKVWLQILWQSSFIKDLGVQVVQSKDNKNEGMTKFVWSVYYHEMIPLCTIYFRGGWEPEKICQLPSSTDREWTVFLLGTCCRFQNVQEGDVLIPSCSIRYDVKQRILNNKVEKKTRGDRFRKFKKQIWSKENQARSAEYIKECGVSFCGNGDNNVLDFAKDYKDIKDKNVVHIQVSDIFQVDSIKDEFTV